MSLQYWETMLENNGTPPKEITRARFWELLEAMYPADWQHRKNSESFRMTECQIGDLYTWCARVGDRYYEMIAPRKTTHGQIMKLIKKEQTS